MADITIDINEALGTLDARMHVASTPDAKAQLYLEFLEQWTSGGDRAVLARASAAVEIARDSGCPQITRGRILRHRARVLTGLGERSRATSDLMEARKVVSKVNTPEGVAELIAIAHGFEALGVNHHARHAYHCATRRTTELTPPLIRIEALEGEARHLSDTGMQRLAIPRLHRAYDIVHKAELSATDEEVPALSIAAARITAAIALANARQKVRSEAIRQIDAAMTRLEECARRGVSRGAQADVQALIAEAYDALNKSEAASLAALARVGYELAGNRRAAVARMLLIQGRNEPNEHQAIDFFKKAFDIVNAEATIHLAPIALLALAKRYRKKTLFPDAQTALFLALKIAEGVRDIRAQYLLHHELSLVFKETEMYRDAYEHYRLFARLRHRVMYARVEREIILAHGTRITQRAEHDRTLLEQLGEELRTYKKNLAFNTVQLERATNMLEGLQRRASGNAPENVSATLPSAEPRRQGRVSGSNESKKQARWTRLSKRFDIVPPDAVALLAEQCPRLTVTELRICVLVRMGLTAPVIAETLDNATRTIYKHRERIRRKLDLAEGVTLETEMTRLLPRDIASEISRDDIVTSAAYAVAT